MTNLQLGWMMALCTKSVITAMLGCTKVIMSDGRDRAAMTSVLEELADISRIEDVMEKERYLEREMEESDES